MPPENNNKKFHPVHEYNVQGYGTEKSTYQIVQFTDYDQPQKNQRCQEKNLPDDIGVDGKTVRSGFYSHGSEYFVQSKQKISINLL